MIEPRWRIFKAKGRWWITRPGPYADRWLAAGVYPTYNEALSHFRGDK